MGDRLAETGAEQGDILGLFTGEGMANKPRYGFRSSGLLRKCWLVRVYRRFGQHIGPHSKINYKAAEDEKPANCGTFAYVSIKLRAIVNTTSDWTTEKIFNTHAPDIRLTWPQFFLPSNGLTTKYLHMHM